MTLACSGKFFLWGWLDVVRWIFRRKEKRRKISRTLQLRGSMKRESFSQIGVFGSLLRQASKDIDVNGENFTFVVLGLVGLVGDEEDEE